MKLLNKLCIKYVFAIFVICISSCSDTIISPEDEIKIFIETAKLAVEKRSHNDLADLIDENYQDRKNLNKKQLVKLSHGYFFTHKNIHLLTKIDSITFQNENSAFVVLHVAMAGSVISDLNAITSLRARVYRFELQLIKNNVWLLQQASWKSAEIKDML